MSGKASRKENVRVVARFRPVNEREATMPESEDEYSLLIDEKASIVGIRHAGMAGRAAREEAHQFVFDKVFGPEVSQTQLFNDVAKDAVHWIAEGYNGTLLAYGQTGTGKTFTMFGHEGGDPRQRGLIPRATELLFHLIADNDDIAEVNIKCSFLEIYKENIRDLLLPAAEYKAREAELGYVPSLRIRQGDDRGVYVQGLIEKYVYSPTDVLALIKEGDVNRTTAYTRMNDVSSRSHAVLTVTVTQSLKDGTVRVGKLNLVDLAGSENVNKSKAEGKTLQEAQKINKSLSALGNVIYALTEKSRDHVPYRDSRLTYLLQDSLGGNTKTVLLVTASPHQTSYLETLSTLKFAKRAKQIKNVPRVNKQESVAQLRALVAYLEEQAAADKQRQLDMETVLSALGVEKDDAGQYRVPRDLKGAQLDDKAANQAKAREVRLLRRVDRYERKFEKIEKTRRKEHAYYAQLKDLFNKQRDLAQSLSAKLRKRDETILFLTNELDEYAQFQASLEEAVAADGGAGAAAAGGDVLAQMLRRRPGGAGGGGRPHATAAAMSLDARSAAGGPYDYEVDSPGRSPTESEASSALSADRRLPLGFRPGASGERVLSGVDFRADAPGAGSAAAAADRRQRTEAEEARRREEQLRKAVMRKASRILEAGGVFVKYPYGRGFMAKPSSKQIFFDRQSGHMYYWDVDSKIKTTSKYISLGQITHLYVGKLTEAFRKGTAKGATEERCFSIKDAERTLDLEAESAEMRDAWVCAIAFVARELGGADRLSVHGDLPEGERDPLSGVTVDDDGSYPAGVSLYGSDAGSEAGGGGGSLHDAVARDSASTRVGGALLSVEEDGAVDQYGASRGRGRPRNYKILRTGSDLSAQSSGIGASDENLTRDDVLREMATADRDAHAALRRAKDVKRQGGARAERKRGDGDNEDDEEDDEDDDEVVTHMDATANDRGRSDEKPFKVRAMYNFTAQSDLQLSFKKGDILTILSSKKEADSGGAATWWDAAVVGDSKRAGAVGSVPSNFVRRIE